MWGIRQKVSLLADHGFPFDEVYHWPLGMISDEATTIERRVNRQIATEAIMLQAAASTVMAPKEGGEHFRALIEQMTGD